MELKNKTVLITGGTSWMIPGARCLGVHTFQSGVSDQAAIVELHKNVLAKFPSLDTLINNAGIMRNLKVNEARDLSDVTRDIETNLNGPVRMIQ